MEGIMKNAIFEKYGIYQALTFEESDRRYYLSFSCGSGLYVAVMLKGGKQVVFYKHEKELIINED